MGGFRRRNILYKILIVLLSVSETGFRVLWSESYS